MIGLRLHQFKLSDWLSDFTAQNTSNWYAHKDIGSFHPGSSGVGRRDELLTILFYVEAKYSTMSSPGNKKSLMSHNLRGY